MPLVPSSLVLVCFMPSPRDMEIARLLGWYRIPLRTAPKVVFVDYLAFYQSGSFGNHGTAIQYVAEVRGHELTTRAALLHDEADHPHAHEEYYKIQIGALEKLANPITADKWKRLTFLYTTGEYLLAARTINDLVVNDDERALLWKSLRERAEQAHYRTNDLPEPDIDPLMLAALLGIREDAPAYDASASEDG